eukprot:TRINITY_DN4405_c0_g3_i1.p1 TRINITY_DN4405_c0_g3~~TRINITY_DN4405_c0_g3_i1.p1  ORF type:complete len:112 (-),score=0.45 TRINITY_DN4405_c0_g3_i1:24-359(-)
MSGWMLKRNQLKQWKDRYFILRPLVLEIYQSPNSSTPQSYINLKGCTTRTRQTKKLGFCFEIFSPSGNNIYSRKGLRGQFMWFNKCILIVKTSAERDHWMQMIDDLSLIHI